MDGCSHADWIQMGANRHGQHRSSGTGSGEGRGRGRCQRLGDAQGDRCFEQGGDIGQVHVLRRNFEAVVKEGWYTWLSQ